MIAGGVYPPFRKIAPVTPEFVKTVTDPETGISIMIYSPAQGYWRERIAGAERILHKPSFVYAEMVHHAQYWEKKLQTNLTKFMQEIAESQLALLEQELEHEQWDAFHKYGLSYMRYMKQ